MSDAAPPWPGVVAALAWTLVHFLWQGALVGVAFGLGRHWLAAAAPRHRYRLGLTALLLLAALPVLTLRLMLEQPAAPAAAAASAGGAGAEPWLAVLVLGWALGAGFCSARLVRRYWALRALLEHGSEVAHEWLPLLQRLAARAGVTRPVRLVRSALVQSPCVFGWLAPVIVLPAGLLGGLTVVEVELLLIHELCHLRRGDYVINLLQLSLEALLFYHPVVHWISREVRAEREACCDGVVVDLGADRVDYARTLARLEELQLPADTLAPAAGGGELLARIRLILAASGAAVIHPVAAAGAVLPLLLTALLALVPFALPLRAKAVVVAPATAPSIGATEISRRVPGATRSPAPAVLAAFVEPRSARASAERPRRPASTLSVRAMPAPIAVERLQPDIARPQALALEASVADVRLLPKLVATAPQATSGDSGVCARRLGSRICRDGSMANASGGGSARDSDARRREWLGHDVGQQLPRTMDGLTAVMPHP